MYESKRLIVGNAGETAARVFFRMLGYQASKPSIKFTGDIRVTNPLTGLYVNVEVKTATLRKSKQRYDFTLEKTGHTSITGNVDFVLLLLLQDNGVIIPLLIPQSDIVGTRCISVPKSLNSKYSRYVNCWDTFHSRLGAELIAA